MKKLRARVTAAAITLGAIAAAGCNYEEAISEDQVWLVRTAPADEAIVYAMAPARGTVAIGGGCVRLNRDDGSSVALVYPYDYDVTRQSGKLGVQDGNGRLLYSVGQHVKIGGSVLPEEPTERMVPAEDQRNCKGPYFLVMPEPNTPSQ